MYIPKENGKTRGLAIARYEDKIVQMALKKIIEGKKISYIVDADIKGFFDHIDWKWLIKCVEQHIKDQRIIRLTKRFLRAGIIEGTKYIETTEGTPQGSILSPVLANIYILCASVMV